MKTNIKFTGTDSDEKLKEYTQIKLDSFSKLLDKESENAAVCYVEFSKDTKHQTGDIYTAEVTLEADGKIYRVSKSEPTFEKGIDKVKDDILQAMKVDKGKKERLLRKGSRAIKEMVQESSII